MTWVGFCCSWISSQWDKGAVTDVSFVYSCSLGVFHHLSPGCIWIVQHPRKKGGQNMNQKFAFYLWVSPFYFVNNKGMSAMLILGIFIWQSSSIYDQRWKREGKKLWEHFYVYKRRPFYIYRIKSTEGRNSEVLLYFLALPLALRSAKHKCKIKSWPRVLPRVIHNNVSLCSQENSAVFLLCILFK